MHAALARQTTIEALTQTSGATQTTPVVSSILETRDSSGDRQKYQHHHLQLASVRSPDYMQAQFCMHPMKILSINP
jgi:hypothetical protein